MGGKRTEEREERGSGGDAGRAGEDGGCVFSTDFERRGMVLGMGGGARI